MEKFWAVILIFVIVAAGGLLYVNQVYNPQKETQMAMADVANQTLTAVKLEIGSGSKNGPVEAEEVIGEVKRYCSIPGNTVEITVKTDADPKKYIDNYSDIYQQLAGISNQFNRNPGYENGVLKSIEFTIIE